jgi:hypothetical protein
MLAAEGRWAWWNAYGSMPLDVCVRRARDARLRGVIVKWGYPHARAAFVGAGFPWATERYVYPDQPEAEARRLAADVAEGARFAVINAELEWEPLGPEPMRRLVAEFRRLQPEAELYASVDTRGGRTALPYQRVLAGHVAGWMPMVYPKAFGRSVREAFTASLDAPVMRDARLPVLPTIQTYDGIGASAVRGQIAEVRRRGLRGYQAYTIAHATDAEWAAIVEDVEEEEMMKPYLARERDSPYVWIVWGNSKSYLRDFAHAAALGIDRAVRILPSGTLASLGRVD